MKPNAYEPPRERKTSVIHFRLPSSVAASLAAEIDPAAGVNSVGDVARALALQALAECQRHRQLSAFDVSNLKSYEIFEGEAARILSALPAKFCQTCISSPPYWKQRDYRHHHQLGQERSPDQYINRLADIFMEVHHTMRDDGTLWVNLDDTYWRKQLAGIPWRLAMELQRRGWCWRAEIVWAKASTPEAVRDRPTRAHEAVLLFSKRQQYHYDYEALLEPHDSEWAMDCIRKAQESGLTGRPESNPFSKDQRRAKGTRGITRAEFGALMNPRGKNRRDVWTIKVEKHKGSHSAVMPQTLAELCVQAGSRAGDIVLDPFCGTATTGAAAIKLGRKFVGIDLLKRYVDEARHRLHEAEISAAGAQ